MHDRVKELSKDTGLSLKSYNDPQQNVNYEYNVNNLQFSLYSEDKLNDKTTTKDEYPYSFYNNTLHIIGNKQRGDDLTIIFDGKPLSELKSGVRYEIKSFEGNFQSISDKYYFDYFELIAPTVIRLSKKNVSKSEKEQQTQQKTFDFKPNTTVDLTLFKGKNKIDIKGDVRIESLTKNGYKYKISTPSVLYTLTLDKPFTSSKGVTYNAKLVSKTDGTGTQTMNDLQLKNNTDIKYR